jgi:RNAse (barnase) inhibitor barstar
VRGDLTWLRSGPLHRVHTSAVPELDVFLEAKTYLRVDLDGSRMTTRVEAHAELKRAFDFPEWCGPNWDAFNDCFGGYVQDHSGQLVAVVWTDVDAAARQAPATVAEVGWALLECATGRMPSLAPSVDWRIDLDVFAIGAGPDFDRPT